MEQALNYRSIVLNWDPNRNSSFEFHRFAIPSILAAVLISIIFQNIDIPLAEKALTDLKPRHVAQFIIKPLTPEDPTPPVIDTPQPDPTSKIIDTVSRHQPVNQNQPVADGQKTAGRLERKGLLALKSEIGEMATESNSIPVDTKHRLKAAKERDGDGRILSVSEQLKPNQEEGLRLSLNNELEKTRLSERESRLSTAVSNLEEGTAKNNFGSAKGRKGNDIGQVFNQNKSLLHALYERERRKDSSLKGKIVFQLTILPTGKVSQVKIVMTELKHQELEARLITRIKSFSFAPTNDKHATTIEFPVEFVPS